ncbi:MAG: HAD family phosphatase [Clostridia bacterium]|nr:HAD family phosphatase [Clostridia bacterium]
MIRDIRAAIFDLDGTLVDSLGLWEFFWSMFGEKYLGDPSFRPDPADDRAYRTQPVAASMLHAHEKYGLGATGEALMAESDEIMLDFYANRVETKPGVRELLAYFSKRGVRMCIASATSRDLLEVALRHCGIDGYFETFFSCADLGVGKDKPDVFLIAADYLGAKPEEICVFEDSALAVQTAAGIGMRTVGIYDRNNYGQEVLRATAMEYIAEGESLARLIPKE